MAKKSHSERIKDLIELNKSNLEIRNIIYNEYKIYYTLTDIENKRKPVTKEKIILNTEAQLDFEAKLVRSILIDNIEIPLTRNDIVKLIYKNHHFVISLSEVNRILFSDLKNEIIYNTTDWTYKLRKNERVNSIEEKNKTLLKERPVFNQTTKDLELLSENYNTQNSELKDINFPRVSDNFQTKKDRNFGEEIFLNGKKDLSQEIDKNADKFATEILIDNSTFKIYKKKEFFKPIFYYNFNLSNGDNEIIINLSHELYKPEYEEFIIKIACSMYFTKSSMTSNVIEIFINRLLSNLALIHE
jgi:hypothetical protein